MFGRHCEWELLWGWCRCRRFGDAKPGVRFEKGISVLRIGGGLRSTAGFGIEPDHCKAETVSLRSNEPVRLKSARRGRVRITPSSAASQKKGSAQRNIRITLAMRDEWDSRRCAGGWPLFLARCAGSPIHTCQNLAFSDAD
jgi:hypothetical protein